MTRNQFAAICLAAAAAIGAGVWLLGKNASLDRGQRVGSTGAQQISLTPDIANAQPEPTEINLPTFWATKLVDVEGKEQSLSKWQGKLLVVNFWATWCGPCKEEMPMFSQLQQEFSAKNVQFLGIAADTTEKVKDFQAKFPVVYPLFPADTQGMALSKRLGNRIAVLPHTVILSPSGELLVNKVGPLKREDLLKIFDDRR
jgi:thiol-disulfide isomerase/thioredoxin